MAKDTPLTIYDYVETFQCLGAECEDTCCHGWDMQLDPVRKERYEKEAPELLDAVTSGDTGFIMRRDPITDYCVKLDTGLCSIQRNYGARFLGDACYFYPRVTRRFGPHVTMAATLSCPEVTRKLLYDPSPLARHEAVRERLPMTLKDYLPQHMKPDAAVAVMDAFVALAGDDAASPERTMARIITISESLRYTAPLHWENGLPLLIRLADARLPSPEPSPHDAYYLVQIFGALLHAAHKAVNPRLDKTFRTMQQALGMALDSKTLDVLINRGEEDFYRRREMLWRGSAGALLSPILRRWLQAQIVITAFPFVGFGSTLEERMIILSVRFAFVRLALMCHVAENGDPSDSATVVRIVQSISRFLDHLADPELSMRLYRQAGWGRAARLRALVGDLP